ncbi:hypothetical protein A4X09_0g3868 [Tilletia walkeri]|uniref:Uncharacterized protein n=1 Tax=Tilletia walkeri TaxID=117179 RepID=A0A8X7NA87_9BASI|nr:hypothetical protein A4X09_0g3868 [Tilletia walkeri]
MSNMLGLYSGPSSIDELPEPITCQHQSIDNGLTPTEEFLRRPSLPKRTVSDFAGGDVSFAARRRRTLANGQAFRHRPTRRPSTALAVSGEESPRSPPSMVRSVSMPVATRQEYERQRQSQTDFMLAGPRSFAGTHSADPGVSWSFSWPTNSVEAPLMSSPTRRPSSCSPLDVIPDFQDAHDFSWTEGYEDSAPALSPSSSSTSSRTTSSGPPSPSYIDSPFSLSRRISASASSSLTSSPSSSLSLSPASAPASLIALSSYPRSASSSTTSSSRKAFSPLSNKLSLPGNILTSSYPSFDNASHFGNVPATPSRRTSFANFGDNKAVPYPSPQRRRSLQTRTLDFNRKLHGEAITARLPKYNGAHRRSSSPSFDLSPHLEENENWPTSPTRPLPTFDSEKLVAELEPLIMGHAKLFEDTTLSSERSLADIISHLSKEDPMEFAPTPFSIDDEQEQLQQEHSTSFDDGERDENDDGIQTPTPPTYQIFAALSI